MCGPESPDGFDIPSGTPDIDPSGYVVRATAGAVSKARSKAAASGYPMGPTPIPMEMEGGDRKFYLGQHRGKTYAEVASNAEYVTWAQLQTNPSRQLQDFLAWFSRYYTIQNGEVVTRAGEGLPEGHYVPRVKNKKGSKKPPNPPLERCAQGCNDFSHLGSTMSILRKTCRDCSNVSQEPRQITYTHDPATCPHDVVDRRGSSRSVSRTFCKQCGTFVDEVPAEFQKERRKAAEQALAATEEALSMIQYTTSEDATRELNSDEVESVLSIFTDDIMESMAMGIRMTPNVMHGRLKEAISRSRMLSNDEPSPGGSPDSWARVAHVGVIDPAILSREENILERWKRIARDLFSEHKKVALEDARMPAPECLQKGLGVSPDLDLGTSPDHVLPLPKSALGMGVGRGSCARNSTSTTSSTTWTWDCSKGDRKTLKEDDLETSSTPPRQGPGFLSQGSWLPFPLT